MVRRRREQRLRATMNSLKRFINFAPTKGEEAAAENEDADGGGEVIGLNKCKSNKMMWQNIFDYPFAIVFGFATRINLDL